MKRIALIALSLAACTGSGAPSEADVRDALAQGGNRGSAQAKLLACKRSPDRPGYICDYRAPACNRFTNTCGAERPFTGRFLYPAGKWQQVEDLTAKNATDPATQPLPGVVLASPLPGATPAAAPAVTPSAPVPAASVARPAPVPSPEPELSDKERRQIARWRDADAQCSAGDGDACGDRDDLGDKLTRHGLCYGPPGGFGYDRAWRPCAN